MNIHIFISLVFVAKYHPLGPQRLPPGAEAGNTAPLALFHCSSISPLLMVVFLATHPTIHFHLPTSKLSPLWELPLSIAFQPERHCLVSAHCREDEPKDKSPRLPAPANYLSDLVTSSKAQPSPPLVSWNWSSVLSPCLPEPRMYPSPRF